MKKYTFFETQSGKKIKTAEFDGYEIAERLLEGMMFQATIQDDGTLKVWVKPEDTDYFSQFNTEKFLKEAQEFAQDYDGFQDPTSGEECWFECLTESSVENTSTQTVVEKMTFADMMKSISQPAGTVHTHTSSCGHGKAIPIKATTGMSGVFPTGKNGIEMDGIPKDIQDIIKNAGSVYQVGGNGGTMTIGVDPNGQFGVDTDLDEVEPSKPKVFGKFTCKTIFHDFMGTIGNINLLSKTARIKGKYFDCMNLENIEFKMTLCDDNTFDFEEIVMDGGESVCSNEDIRRYLRAFEDCNVVGYRNKSVIPDMTFVATHTVKDKEIQVDSYLVIDPRKPYNDLLDIMEEPTTELAVEIDMEDFDKKMSELFDDEPETNEPPVPVLSEQEEAPLSSQSLLVEEFLEAKKEKREILRKKMETIISEYKVAKNSYSLASGKMRECDGEIKLLASRIDSLEINEPLNGYYFYIPESISAASFLAEDVRKQIEDKLHSMNFNNTEGFMKVFEDSLFRIRFGLDIDGVITELTDYKNIYPLIKDIDLANEAKIYIGQDGILYYEGQIEWSHLNNKLIRLGFENNQKFEELCNYVPPVEVDEDGEDGEDSYIDKKYFNDDFIFGIYEDVLASNDLGDPQYVIYVSPKSYFEKNGCIYDQHTHATLKKKYPIINKLGNLIGEEIESGYTIYDSEYSETTKHVGDLEAIVDLLCKAGLKFKASFQDMAKNSIGSNITDKIVEVINSTGNSTSIIA